jgi:hypothetical protein
MQMPMVRRRSDTSVEAVGRSAVWSIVTWPVHHLAAARGERGDRGVPMSKLAG